MSLNTPLRQFIPRRHLVQKAFLLSVISILLASPLTGCGDSNNTDPLNSVYVGGLWRGRLALTSNACRLALSSNFQVAHSVSQALNSIELRDDQNRLFVGNIIGDDGFSVDSFGPSDEGTSDGRTCSLTHRFRYDSINDDDDRTAQIRYIILGQCSDESECQSEYAGDGIRD